MMAVIEETGRLCNPNEHPLLGRGILEHPLTEIVWR